MVSGCPECCPKFNPKPWDKKTIKWKDKLFVKDSIRCFLHIPLAFSIKPMMDRVWPRLVKEKVVPKDIVVLTDERSAWGSDWYFMVTKKVPLMVNLKISGTFMTKVYEGHYKNMGHWIKDMNNYVSSKKKRVKKMYFFYTTCPKCAKKYGKNYVVLFAKI